MSDISPPWQKTDVRIDWRSLDHRLIDTWYRKAHGARGVERFLFSFICLNHYYSAWADVSPPPSLVERAVMKHLATTVTIENCWPEFVTLHDVKGRKLELPLNDWRGNTVPRGWVRPPGEYEAADFIAEEYLEIMYQLRCDLFHASRGTAGFKNQLALRFVSDAALALVTYLARDTIAPQPVS